MSARALLGLAMLALALMGGSAFAQSKPLPPFKATNYPIEVRKSLSVAVLECRNWEDGKVTFAPDTVRKVDFNGDGRIDYIVSLDKTKCSSLLSPYCGTGGCHTEFFVTLPNGRVRSIFADTIKRYEIPRPGKVRFRVHHGWCEHGDPRQDCIKDRRIGYKPFSPKRG